MSRPIIDVDEKPILFTDRLVRKIRKGEKTETRRLITKIISKGPVTEFGRSTTPGPYQFHFRDRHALWNDVNLDWMLDHCPYGKVGDHLWVRESFTFASRLRSLPPSKVPKSAKVIYRADKAEPHHLKPWWKPSIHMPRWASRIDLRIEEILVEPLQKMTPVDALAEGISLRGDSKDAPFNALNDFIDLWNEINEKRGFGWASNPFVWVIRFKVV